MEPEDTPRKFVIAIDVRDVLAGGGALLVVVGAAAIHWALAVVVVGAALLGLSWRLAR